MTGRNQALEFVRQKLSKDLMHSLAQAARPMIAGHTIFVYC